MHGVNKTNKTLSFITELADKNKTNTPTNSGIMTKLVINSAVINFPYSKNFLNSVMGICSKITNNIKASTGFIITSNALVPFIAKAKIMATQTDIT